jgi:threonine aldolase
MNSTPKPSVVIIECPHREIGGKCTSLADLRDISRHCREAGVHLHLDGARLWEALPFYLEGADQCANVAEFCSLFDSIYASFYKGNSVYISYYCRDYDQVH